MTVKWIGNRSGALNVGEGKRKKGEAGITDRYKMRSSRLRENLVY